jgi:hypothetical protein
MRRVVGAASRRNSIRAQHPMQVLVQCTRLGRQPQFDYDGRMRQVGLGIRTYSTVCNYSTTCRPG